jgi:erythromycin esterase-like protein
MSTLMERRLREPHGDRSQRVIEQLSALARPLADDGDLDLLLERIGDAHYVLLGEASHGTSEYYTWRTRISQRLIREKGFRFIAVEGDWPDCMRVDRYAKCEIGERGGARAVLEQFDRWPTWMWANREVETLAEWLREHNACSPRSGVSGSTGSTSTACGTRCAP